jgi:GNAT superfamily N-acetyltransferase
MHGAGRAAACQALAAILDSVAKAQFPPADGRVTILPQPSARDAGVFAFTGHSVIFADADPAWVAAQLPAGDLSAPLSPRFVQGLAEHIGREAHQTDMLACATALPGLPPVELTAEADPAHPRIIRALRYRDEIRTWQADGGVLLLGRGAGGRWEVAIEVDADHRGRGLGRRLATAARHLVPGGAPLWAQIAPGNAASVRAFLAAGFRPVGAESVLTPHERTS